MSDRLDDEDRQIIRLLLAALLLHARTMADVDHHPSNVDASIKEADELMRKVPL